MSKGMIAFIAGIVINLGLVAGAWFLYQRTIPDSSEIEARMEHIEPVDKNVLSSDILIKLNERTKYGEIPVQVKEEELKKENPFE